MMNILKKSLITFLTLALALSLPLGSVNANVLGVNDVVETENTLLEQVTKSILNTKDSAEKQAEQQLSNMVERLINDRETVVDSSLTALLEEGVSTEALEIILTYRSAPTEQDVQALEKLGIIDGLKFQELPMIAVSANIAQVEAILASNIKSKLLSVYQNKELQYFMKESREYIGVNRQETDNDYRVWNGGAPVSGKGIGVAVIDSGVDGTHPDLKPNVVKNVKVVAGTLNTGLGKGIIPPTLIDLPNTDTSSGHGTHVAGTVAGTGVMSSGDHRGVAPGADLIGISTGEAISILWGLQAFDWTLANQHKYDIRVVTNSWGSSFSWSSMDPTSPINVASKLTHDRGMVVLFASGNDGGYNTLNPYSYWPWVMGIAAGTKDGNLATFSSRGLSEDLDKDVQTNRPEAPGWAYLDEKGMTIFDLLHPTVTAPGVDIIATRSNTVGITALAAEQDATSLDPALVPFYTYMSGTSMATPHMAGVVALLLEANPYLTPDEVKSIVEVTASPMGKYQLFEVGAGYVNVYEALKLAFALRGDTGLSVSASNYDVVTPDNKSIAYYGSLAIVDGKFVSSEEATAYAQEGNYTTGVRSFHELVDGEGNQIEFTDRVALLKVRDVQLNNTNSLVVSTGNLFFYKQAGGDEMLSTGGETNIMVSDIEKLWFNHRGSFSSATGSGGAERSKSFSFNVKLAEVKIDNEELVNEFAAFGEDQYTLNGLVQANLLNIVNGYNGEAQMTKAEYIDHVYRMLGVQKFVPKTGHTFTDINRDHAMFTKVESVKDAGLLTFVDGNELNINGTVTKTEVIADLLVALDLVEEAKALAASDTWTWANNKNKQIAKADICDKPADGSLAEAAWAYGLANGWVDIAKVDFEVIKDAYGFPIGFEYLYKIQPETEATKHFGIMSLNGAMNLKYQ
jgi:subtilisin family serine protease